MKKLTLLFVLSLSSCIIFNTDPCAKLTCNSDEICRVNSGEASCEFNFCGDGVFDNDFEECDASGEDGGGSLCNQSCQLGQANVGCGDGIIDPTSYCLGALGEAHFQGSLLKTQAVDLDHDGLSEIFVQSRLDHIDHLLLYTLEQGTPLLEQELLTAPSIASFTSLDLDQDQDEDLVVQNGEGPEAFVQLFFNEGNVFSTPQTLSNGSIALIADMNADNILDIALTDQGTSFFLFDADGSFTAGPVLQSVIAIATADFNNDGLLDVLAKDELSELHVFLQKPNGGFATAIPLPTDVSFSNFISFFRETSTLPNESIIRDWDNDGDIDLLAKQRDPNTQTDSRVVLLINQGDGTFLPPSLLFHLLDASGLGDINANKVDLRDWDDDGDFDILFGELAGGLTLLINHGGTFEARTFVSGPSDIANGVAGDFNGDGDLDFLVLFGPFQNEEGSLTVGISRAFSIFENEGGGQFREVLQREIDISLFVRVRDFNGDGFDDLHFLDSFTDAILLNNQTGDFQEIRPLALVFENNFQDLNNDGLVDLIEEESSVSSAGSSIGIRLGGLD